MDQCYKDVLHLHAFTIFRVRNGGTHTELQSPVNNVCFHLSCCPVDTELWSHGARQWQKAEHFATVLSHGSSGTGGKRRNGVPWCAMHRWTQRSPLRGGNRRCSEVMSPVMVTASRLEPREDGILVTLDCTSCQWSALCDGTFRWRCFDHKHNQTRLVFRGHANDMFFGFVGICFCTCTCLWYIVDILLLQWMCHKEHLLFYILLHNMALFLVHTNICAQSYAHMYTWSRLKQ